MDERDRSRALEMIPYALYVVGVGRETEVGAYTANWVCQASFKPPLLMLGVKRNTRHHERITTHRVLTVNFLGEEQKRVAADFMKWNDPEGGTIAGHRFTTESTGAPVLEEAPAWVECRVKDILEGGDHDVVVAEVVGAGCRREARPLLMVDTGWTYGG